MSNPIPVICDRCGAQGAAGEAAFTDFGDLLDFAPVPRRNNRVDGWSEDRQRSFIAAFSRYTHLGRYAACFMPGWQGIDKRNHDGRD